ncbi:MAG: S8 family serine peptidase [Gammaproteobacteria bacterium]|nr:S8 family serine peptidase [Gammaproteobacteria bacterium]
MPHRRILVAVFLGVSLVSPLLAQDLSQPYVEGQVLVRFAPGAAAVERDAARNALLPTGGRSFQIVPGLELVATQLSVPQAIAVLANNPNVEYVEPDYIVQAVAAPNDTYFDLQWGLDNQGQEIQGNIGTPGADIDMLDAWNASSSAGTLVAVIDTGTQVDHPDLEANLVAGWDFFDDDADPSDTDGHGTHTAGTVAAVADNGSGVAGVCPNCRIMPLRFLGPNGGSTSDAIAALDYAVANEATVSNNSWGGGGYSQALYDAIAAAGAAGHVFVAAAGNSGTDTDVYAHYPSAYNLSNIISVAATTNNDLRASFSNYGDVSVDLGAPGLDIASTYTNGQYVWSSGTSMAAPHVTGVVALLQGMSLSPAQDSNCPAWADNASGIVKRVLDSVRQAPAMLGITVTGGILNAYNAIVGICPPQTTPPPPLVAPENFSAEDGSDGTAKIYWDAVTGATEYWLERREKKGKRLTNATVFYIYTGQTHTPFVDTTVVAGKTYAYRVASANASSSSPMTSWAEVTISSGSSSDDDGGSGGGSGKCHPKRGC